LGVLALARTVTTDGRPNQPAPLSGNTGNCEGLTTRGSRRRPTLAVGLRTRTHDHHRARSRCPLTPVLGPTSSGHSSGPASPPVRLTVAATRVANRLP